MKNNLKLILLLSSISLTSIASNASNIIDETITSTSTTQEITTATSSSNQILQEDLINWDLIAKHRESLKNNNENKNIFKIETELTKTQFNELKEYLNTKFADHPSTKEILEAIQDLEKSNGLNSQNLLLLSLYHTFKIRNQDNQFFTYDIKTLESEEINKIYEYFETKTPKEIILLIKNKSEKENENTTDLNVFKDQEYFPLFYPIFGKAEMPIQLLTNAFLNNVFPIGIVDVESTVHDLKLTEWDFAIHDFIHGFLNIVKRNTTNEGTSYSIISKEELKNKQSLNEMLKDLIQKADQKNLSEQDKKIFDVIMFYIVHELEIDMSKIDIENKKNVTFDILKQLVINIASNIAFEKDFFDTKKLLKIAGFKEEVLHRCHGKLAFLAIKWYQIACKLMDIDPDIEQKVIKIEGHRELKLTEAPIDLLIAKISARLKDYREVKATIKSLESFAKGLGIMQTSQQTN